MRKQFLSFLVAVSAALLLSAPSFAAKTAWTLSSPDGRIKAEISSNGKTSYSVTFRGKTILSPSEISMTLESGEVFGEGKVKGVKTGKVEERGLPAVAYTKSQVDNIYNYLTLSFKNCDIEFRAYDNAVTYRFVSTAKKGSFNISSEKVELKFPEDWSSWAPYPIGADKQTIERQFRNSFEHFYDIQKISEWSDKKIAFLPVLVDAEDGVKVLITESDLRGYPGLFLFPGGGHSLKGVNAPYPKTVEPVGVRGIVKEREEYIAKAEAGKTFPWRIVGIFDDDKDLPNSDLTWQLAKPADPNTDWSWVKPGHAAWEWWSNWNLYGVDFKSGVNTVTYKYFIDFAAKFGLEYVLMDAGWYDGKKNDPMTVIPQVDMEELARYGAERNVGLILWAGYTAMANDYEKVFDHYSKMGIKGFKVDFFDRDDQMMVEFLESIAKSAAKHHLLIDFHGVFKPSGLERTYPNVINYEGVYGLEQMKWGADEYDQVLYDVTVPFIRMAAGRMDYTQGAMINRTKGNSYSDNSNPVSQGTRCRQIAEYVVFESPLVMLCDSPSRYYKEPECTEFIAGIPTTWDETVPLKGKVGEYIAIARRKGDDWFVGALTNWDERELELDLSFTGGGNMTVFQDGVNATKMAEDYKKVETTLPAEGKITVKMAPGGGWAAKISK